MVASLARQRVLSDHVLRDASSVPVQFNRSARHSEKETSMQWTTPTACDLRFGFEITMYVSAR